MIFEKQIHDIQEPSVLKRSGFYYLQVENSAHFLYPIQPQSVSAVDPILKSIEDVMQISDISMHIQSQSILFVEQNVENTCQEQNDKHKFTLFLKDFPLFQDGYTFGEESQKLTFMVIIQSKIMGITTNCAILIILILLPVQIAFNQEHLTVLIFFIWLMQMIQFLNNQLEVVNLQQFLKLYVMHQIPYNIVKIYIIKIIISAVIMMQQYYLPALWWLAYFFTFMSNRSIFTIVQYQIQKYIVCILPEQQIYSQYFLIVSKVTLIIHILNCYLYQSLQQNEIGNSYFNTLTNITINTVTLNTNFQQQNTYVQVALLASYIFIILILIESNQKCNQLLNELQIYFQNNNIPISTKLQVYDELMNKTQQNTHIYGQLPSELQAQISYTQKISFIQDNFREYDVSTKFQLTQICTVQHYQKGQFIIKLNQQDDNSLYYLDQGQVSVKLTKEVKISLKNKSTFGQLSFFTQCLRTATVICDANCTVYKLQRNQFLDCLTNHEKELFQLTKDSIEFQNKLPIKCFCCQQYTHIIANCPQINYLQVAKHCFQVSIKNNQTQSRAYYRRKNFPHIKTIIKQSKFNLIPDSQFNSTSQQDKEDISILKQMGYLSQDSYKLLSEKILAEIYDTIKGQIYSSSRICSLQDTHKLIPQVMHEHSHDSMSIKGLTDNESQKITRKKNRKKSQYSKLKLSNPQPQKQYDSDSLVESSPSFKGEQSNSSNQQLPHWGTLIKSQGSYPQKTESAVKEGFSSFQAFSVNDVLLSFKQKLTIPNHSFKDDIDKMQIFQHYYPKNNYDQIIQSSIRQI